MKVIAIVDMSKALLFMDYLGLTERDVREGNEQRMIAPRCGERVPSNSGYFCDRMVDHKDHIHISWFSRPSKMNAIEIWGEGLTEAHYVFARLLCS